MIEGKINPPCFDIGNEKIVLRHIFASAFSFFWKTNREYYTKTIGDFIDKNGFQALYRYLESQPTDLLSYLIDVVPESLQNYFGLISFSWVKLLFNGDLEKKGIANVAQDRYLEEIGDLETALKKEKEGTGLGVYRINQSIKTLREQQMISFLSKNNLIPKYGFPVDTVELQSAGPQSGNDLRLSRDLFSAISEYAPESEVVADGRLLKSRYVRKLTGYEWPRYRYVICPKCSTFNKTLSVNQIEICRQCGYELKNSTQKQYIIPKFGFVLENENPKAVGTNKPERTYKGQISYVGEETRIHYESFLLNGIEVEVGSSKMDSLAVLNESRFFICDTCGYGMVLDKCFERVYESEHKNPNGYRCNCKRLTQYSLGHEFQTNVVLLKFPSLGLTSQNEAWTILYSILEGLSKYLNIDRNELSGCLQWCGGTGPLGGSYAFVLFDNTPGGAGYVRQLCSAETLISVFREGFRTVYYCNCGGAEADTACYGCLLNYYNQKQHEILKRRYAIEFYQLFSPSPDLFNVKAAKKPENTEREASESLSFIE